MGWDSLSSNPTVTWDFVKKRLDMPWNWVSLSKNLLTPEIYNAESDYPWQKIGIVQNPNLILDKTVGEAHLAIILTKIPDGINDLKSRLVLKT